MDAVTLTRRDLVWAWWPFFPFYRPSRETLAGVEFEVLRRRFSPRRYVVIHGDETTAKGVVRAHLRRWPGKALLVAGGDRYVKVAGGAIDPNRLFSREGAARSFARLNPSWSAAHSREALDWLDAHREKLIRALAPPPGGLLVAVHNNSRGYSVRSEIPISNRVHLPRLTEPQEFILCVDAADFGRLQQGPYNVVLQESPAGADDGSLSRLAARRKWRYINLEAELGKADTQSEMLTWIEKTLP